ncbi:MAG: hypothetical protein IJH12_07555 [Clostridia bacterium]|nr:hypothetical protein [Clostridia bacterium]
MKKAIIIIISVLVILAGTGAVLWFFTPVFDFLKPASDNFTAQAKKLFGAKEELSYNDYLKSIEPLKGESKSYVAKGNISANITLPSSIIDYTTQRQINNTALQFESSYDNNSKATSANINWKYSNSDILNLKMVKDGKKVTLSSKDFYDKALTFDMSKFRTFCKNNNLDISDADIDKIEKMLDNNSAEEMSNMIYDLFYLTEDEYKALQKDYGDILKKFVDDDKYTTKKNQKITVNGEEIKATGYSLTLSGKDAYNFIKKLAEDAKNNDNLKSIIVKKLNLLKKYGGTLAQAGLDEYETYSVNPSSTTSYGNTSTPSAELESVLSKDFEKSDIEEAIDAFLQAFEQAESSFSSIKKSIKITIYSDKKSNPVKLDVAIVKNDEDDGTVVFTEEVGSKKNTYTIDVQALAKAVAESSNSSTIPVDKIVIVDEIEKNSDTERKGTMTASIKASGQKMEVGKIEYEIVNSDSEIKNNIKISSDLISGAAFELKSEFTGLNSDNQSMAFDLNASYSGYKVKVTANESIEYGKSNIEQYNDTNSVDVFSKSKEEIQKIVTDVVTKASDVLPSRLANYGIRVTKDQIMSIIPKTETPTTETPADATTETTTTTAEPAA